MAADPRTPRSRRSDGQRSRAAILREAARLATVEGLDGLSLSRLAEAVGMSKSGLFAHFEDLVVEPAAEATAGLPRLRAYTELFLAHVEEGVFPGGCFFISAVGELDARPGPVRDDAVAYSQRWLALLADEVAAAQAAGELDPAADPPQIAFELHAFMVLGNMQFVATANPSALDRSEERR